MPGPSRPITDMDISTALPKLFHSLPPRKGNLSELADGYKVALHGCTMAGLTEAIYRFIRGDIEGQSTAFAPSPPELSRAVRAIDRQLEAINRPPAIEYTPLPFLTVEMRRDAERQRMAAEGRILICSADSHSAAQQMAKLGKVPPGSVYSGLLGEFYSPINYQPEGTDNEQRHSPDEPDNSRRDAASATDASTGPASKPSWRGLFAPDEPTDELAGQSKASGTIDGDRGPTGHSEAAGTD